MISIFSRLPVLNSNRRSVELVSPSAHERSAMLAEPNLIAVTTTCIIWVRYDTSTNTEPLKLRRDASGWRGIRRGLRRLNTTRIRSWRGESKGSRAGVSNYPRTNWLWCEFQVRGLSRQSITETNQWKARIYNRPEAVGLKGCTCISQCHLVCFYIFKESF